MSSVTDRKTMPFSWYVMLGILLYAISGVAESVETPYATYVSQASFEHFERTLEAQNLFIKDNPNESWGYADRAAVLTVLGRLYGALSDLENAIRLDPGNSQYYYDLGHIFLKLMQPHEAQNAFAECKRLTKDDVGCVLGDAESSLAAGDMGRARQLILDVSTRELSDLKFYKTRGKLLLAFQMYEPAKEDLSHVAREFPADADAHYLMAEVHFGMENYLDAVVCASRAIELYPEIADGYVLRALAYAKTSDLEHAREDVATILRLGRRPPPELLKSLR